MKNQFDYRIFIVVLIILVTFSVKILSQNSRLSDSSLIHIDKVLCWENDILSVVEFCPEINVVPQHVRPLYFEKISINMADSGLLQTIPGIGPGLAANIIKRRKKKGRIRTPDDLLEVKGIGVKRKEMLMTRVSFD